MQVCDALKVQRAHYATGLALKVAQECRVLDGQRWHLQAPRETESCTQGLDRVYKTIVLYTRSSRMYTTPPMASFNMALAWECERTGSLSLVGGLKNRCARTCSIVGRSDGSPCRQPAMRSQASSFTPGTCTPRITRVRGLWRRG